MSTALASIACRDGWIKYAVRSLVMMSGVRVRLATGRRRQRFGVRAREGSLAGVNAWPNAWGRV